MLTGCSFRPLRKVKGKKVLFPLVIPATPEELRTRIRDLETALAVSTSLLHRLAQRLETKLGPGFLGDELQKFANSLPGVREFIARIDRLISEGQQPAAAREFREYAGVTWDQAHDAIAKWGCHPTDEKVRSLQLSNWARAMCVGVQASAGLQPMD
jgi:hypothetical protein